MKALWIAAALVLAAPAWAESYEYDAQGRVTRVTYDDGTWITYGYDAAGNIVRQGAQGKPPAPLPGAQLPPPAQEGCGCGSGPAGSLAPLALLFVLARRRRKGLLTRRAGPA